MPIAATNDFVVKFANVNGSGSASANELFARCILRMGVPVCSRNIFPSNIQGLPTWYEVRVSGEGWLGRRGGVDLMVAMNPQTWNKDLAEIDRGGYLLYDSTKPLTGQKLRDDITLLGVPLTALSNSMEGTIPRERQLLKNVIYLGALSALLGFDAEVVEGLIGSQFKGKDKLIKLNMRAVELGHDYVTQNLAGKCQLKVERSDKVGERIFIAGNDAAALGCVYGGATVAAWYPITPSTSLAEAFMKHCKKLRVDPVTKQNKFAIVQAEDEIAAIGMVLGANWNGARAFTATSGPGISLMQEFFGLAYYAEVPAVIFDIQRGGPSTGMPTRTQQSDILLAAYASHGDTKHVLIFPADPGEAFEFAAQSFDLAERLQTPIFVMMDLDIGMNDWLCKPIQWDDSRKFDRGKLISAEELEAGKPFARYLDVDGDAVPYRTLPGVHPTKGNYFTRGSSHDAYARYSEEGRDYTDVMQRLLRKFETAKRLVPQPVRRDAGVGTRWGAIYYGSTSVAMDEAIVSLEAQGLYLDTMRIRAFPFAEEIVDFINAHDQVFVVEQNRDAQLQKLLVNECAIDPARFISILHYDGTPITARFIEGAISERMSLKARKEAAE
ncbi:MAG TPA: 2-oxoacid:acceptor oxidoreductase subunit alpha [Rhizomicrobium sp.]|jgi:2-oxoglutarate ferredoxin oxidoreductase subunit alpha